MKMKLKRFFLVVLACLTVGWGQAFADITPDINKRVYVKADGVGVGDSWENATGDLAEALTAAAADNSEIKEIWVAEGIYKPTSGTDPASTFKIPAEVKVYGGFAGTEASVDLRDISGNVTTLSGDIGEPITNTDNVHHVVTIAGDGVVLDGFTIRDGYVGDPGYGAGIFSEYKFTLNNSIITENWAGTAGGGINATNGLIMNNCVVSKNTGSTASNLAGGIRLEGGALLTNSLISQNTGSKYGQDISFQPVGSQDQMVLTNTTVVSKNGVWAIHTFGDRDKQPEIVLQNSIVTTSQDGKVDAIRENNSPGTIIRSFNSFLQNDYGNLKDVEYVNKIDGITNLKILFEDLAGGDYRLTACSPLINVGDNDFVLDESVPDLAGKLRIVGTAVDIGCYEFQDLALLQHVLTLNSGEELLSQNIKRGYSISEIVFTYSGGAEGATVEGLPADVTYLVNESEKTITISGTPTADNAFGTYNYTVSTTGNVNECTPVATREGSITLSPNVTPTNGVLYVKKGGTGKGSSWDNAIGELSEALQATEYYPEVKQIWVGTGTLGEPATFMPAYAIGDLDWDNNPTTDRDKTFLLLDGIKVYGGFDPGSGITDLTHKRDSSLTILSGMLTGEEDGDRAYHVVTAVNHSAMTNDEINHIVIDGFTITGGQADGSKGVPFDGEGVPVGSLDVYQSSGAGVYALAGEGFITITASDIHGNTANSDGGGVYADARDGSVFITGNTIHSNTIQGGEYAFGGGIFAYGYVKITENEILENEASGSFEARGGGIYAKFNGYERNTGGILEHLQAMYIGNNQIKNNKALHDNNAAGGGIALGIYYGGGGVDQFVAPASIGVYDDNRALIVYNTLEGNIAGNEDTSDNTGGGISVGYRYYDTGGDVVEVTSASLLRAASEVRFIKDVIIGYNLLKSNQVYGDGGGIYVGLELGSDDPGISVVNNVIVENTATNDGGGIYLPGSNYYRFTLNNTIANNDAENNGGGVYHNDSGTDYTDILNSILYGNTAGGSGNDLYLNEYGGESYISNNLIGSVEGSELSGKGFFGNIIGDQGDAVFVGGDADNKYSLATGSPAINKGSDENWTFAVDEDIYPDVTLGGFVDFAGNDRFMGASIDIGAYEFNSACIPVMVWLGGKSGSEQDWNTDANWYPAGIPQSCTDVYIPGVSVTGNETYYFPSLTGSQEDNLCHRIFFLPGAQLGRPDLLTYVEAHVEIDYGKGSLDEQAKITYENFVAIGSGISSQDRVQFAAQYSGVTLSRNRWNMLSAPLKGMLTGDFAFGGFPFSFIQQFDAKEGDPSFLEGNWAPFSSKTDFEFDPGQGFGHFYYGYMDNTPYGMDNSAGSQWNEAKSYSGLTAEAPAHKDGASAFGLAQQNGILHFPYFADDYLSAARRIHEYNGTETSGTSTFHFVYQSPLKSTLFLQFTGDKEEMVRTGNAYRFITDGDYWAFNYNAGTLDGNKLVLVGNPYMSALDFGAFYAKNADKIKNWHQIYEGDDYHVYNGVGDAFVAPMQSFLVETTTGFSGELLLAFTPEMAVTNTGTKLRAFGIIADRLTITASNANGRTSAAVRWLEDAKDGFCNRDISKIIDNVDNLPRVYTLAGMENGKLRALSVNSIQSNSVMVPVGVTSSYKGEVTFTISGMDAYGAEISFVDAATGARQDITGQGEFTYTYTHDGDKASIEDRFYLHFSKISTGTEDIHATSLNAYAQQADLIVLSADGNPVERVAVYDIQGRLLSEHRLAGASPYRVENVFELPGIYAVKIYTKQAVGSIKVIR